MADDVGASETHPVQCGMLRPGGHVIIKSRPCKITDVSTIKEGKHGHTKVQLVAFDIFSGKKFEETHLSTHNFDVPNVQRTKYQLLEITDNGFLSLKSDDGAIKDDIKVPDTDLGTKIEQLFRTEKKEVDVKILSAMGLEKVVGAEENSSRDIPPADSPASE